MLLLHIGVNVLSDNKLKRENQNRHQNYVFVKSLNF